MNIFQHDTPRCFVGGKKMQNEVLQMTSPVILSESISLMVFTEGNEKVIMVQTAISLLT